MNIHRYNWNSIKLEEAIIVFSDLHKHTHKEDFNEYFEQWLGENEGNIDIENQYLQRCNYTGDIHTKILNSIKYYYIKKFNTPSKPHCVRIHKERINKDILQLIKKVLDVTQKPSITYPKFIISSGLEDTPILKKAYKNQYYQHKLNGK
tara:strand:- start:521 stop:967 length:447 start_codon:yes stop_codon:yes gene_type:complete